MELPQSTQSPPTSDCLVIVKFPFPSYAMCVAPKPAPVHSPPALFFLIPVKFGTLQGAAGGAGHAGPVVTVTVEVRGMQLTPGVDAAGLVA